MKDLFLENLKYIFFLNSIIFKIKQIRIKEIRIINSELIFNAILIIKNL